MGFDLNLPNLDEALQILATGGTTGLQSAVANAIVTNPDVKAAAQTYAEQTAADKLAAWYIKNKKPIMYGGLALGVLAAGWFFAKK